MFELFTFKEIKIKLYKDHLDNKFELECLTHFFMRAINSLILPYMTCILLSIAIFYFSILFSRLPILRLIFCISFFISFLNRFRIAVGRVSSLMARAYGNAAVHCLASARPLRFAWFIAVHVFKSCDHNAHSVIARLPIPAVRGTTGNSKRLYY